MRCTQRAALLACTSALAFVGSLHAQDHEHMQMDMDAGARLHLSAQAIALVTTAWPTPVQRHLTEGYITQPFAMAMFRFPGDWLEASATVNLEGLTLQHGELTTGMWGEGYVDRRHPHTYLHEIMLTAKAPARSGLMMSASLGKGFVPFGSDDPMMRPLVKYPSNHHLAQIPERFMAIAAAGTSRVTAELSLFGGDEPQSPGDNPNLDRFGDSWSARLTYRPSQHTELQSSLASVTSPENAGGGGQDQRKVSVSARYSGSGRYGLLEFARTAEQSGGKTDFRLGSFLAEGSVAHASLTWSARLEVSERPDEERLGNPFRNPVPVTDFHILGISRWTILSAGVATAPVRLWSLNLVPLGEGSVARAEPRIPNSVFDPAAYYGSGVHWNLSIGLKLLGGEPHGRMGRYGIAAN